MNLEQYSHLAIRTLNDLESSEANLAHMALGITGEAGEVADIIKKHYAYGKSLDTLHLVEEVGDIMFYLNGLLAELDVEWSEVLEVNIKKLEARYPDLKFNADHAINRDVEAEKEVMVNSSWVEAEDEAARELHGAK
jgi:NTP pyrophosphatase (non-canonical NTP hydrolase)